MVNRKFTHSYLRVFVLLFKMFKTLHSVDDSRVRLNYCDLRSSVRRAVSKRTFYVSKRAFAVSKRAFAVSKRTFAVSKRTFAVSKRVVFPRDMSCLADEIVIFSWLKRNVWLLYTIFTI